MDEKSSYKSQYYENSEALVPHPRDVVEPFPI
jgi:hypothetical protein